jgi:AcrR family transcriptional regulator
MTHTISFITSTGGNSNLIDKKAELLRCGRELFSTQGFKDTNVADITKMAGFGTGTFYNYYSSKDELFMEIFLEENVKLKKQIMKEVDPDGEPISVIKEFLYKNLTGMNENPILKEWYNHEVFGKIEQKYREANGIEHVDFLYYSFTEIIKKWQSEGKMRADIDVEMIMAIFAALINIDTHKEEVGLQYFPQVLDYLTGFVMKGLEDCRKK